MWSDDCFDPLTAGRIGGGAMLGTQAIGIERNTPNQRTNMAKPGPFPFSIPELSSQFVQQIKVATSGKLFMPSFLPDYSPHYNVGNHVKKNPTLVFQSPLNYIGLPPGME